MLRITPAMVLATSWLAMEASPARAARAQATAVTGVELGAFHGPGRWLRDLWLDRLTIPLGLADPNRPHQPGTSGRGSFSAEF